MSEAEEAEPQAHQEVEAVGTGFHPPATVAIACVLVAAGLGIMAIGTTALRLPHGIKLSLGAHLVKVMLGGMILGAGVGLYLLKAWSLNVVRLFIFLGGIVAPLYPWEANPLHIGLFVKLSKAIDWEFAWTLRGMTFLTSAVVLAYLSRRSVVWALEHGGVPASFEGYVCAGCNNELDEVSEEGCEICGGPLYEQFRSVGGVCYTREI